MYNLIIDDLRSFQEIQKMMSYSAFYDGEWIIVRNFSEFVSEINSKGLPNKISFDHDLADFVGDKEYTGKDCANLIIDICIDLKKDFPKYRVHSANPGGRDNIVGLIENFIRLKDSGFFE